MFLDLFFEEIVNLAIKYLILPVVPAIPKIVFGAGGAGWMTFSD